MKREYFHFLAATWDVTTAKTIIMNTHRTREVSDLDLKSMSNYFGGINIDEKGAMLSDITKPIIAVLFYDRKSRKWYPFPIDGWHRAFYAHSLGHETIKCYILDKKESRKVRIR